VQTTDQQIDQQEAMFEDLTDSNDLPDEPVVESAEAKREGHGGDSRVIPGTVLTVDDFAELEERIVRTVELVQRERKARLAAQQRVVELEGQVRELQAQSESLEHLQEEIASLRGEREQVRQRVERLLSQLDALEL